jgi:sulfatase maturation enzyme AslB (radical SAM superfamily)
LTFTLKSIPRGMKYTKDILYSCNVPFRHVSIDQNSDCFLCDCEGWLPIPVGKVEDFDTLEQVWNSPVSQMLQQDIKDKKFSWCAVQHCGIIQQNIDRENFTLNISIDDSCNLACPSCRRELRMLEQGETYDKKIKDLNQIMKWLDNFTHPIMISFGGTGDALASRIFRNLIKNYRYKPGQTFQITTNGLLLKKVIAESSIKSAICNFSISVDAGTDTVYENVRRPGKWAVLLENLEWLHNNQGQSAVTLNFVVQKNNFQDLPAFVDLCKRFNFRGSVQPLNDWGTWNSRPVQTPDPWTVANGTFLDHNVADSAHPQHDEFLQVLKDLIKHDYNFLTINPFFNQFQ